MKYLDLNYVWPNKA